MTQGVEIELPDGTLVQVVPTAHDGIALLSVDEISVIVKRNDNGFDVDMKSSSTTAGQALSGSQVREIDVQVGTQTDEGVERSVLRTCIRCNGRRYCITGGCANTPCGWICG